MVDEKNMRYLANSEEVYNKIKSLYKKFSEQYSIGLNENEGKLIVAESFNREGIKIYPEQEKGSVFTILALKPASELEIKLIKNDLISGFSRFETKNNEIIIVCYKRGLRSRV